MIRFYLLVWNSGKSSVYNWEFRVPLGMELGPLSWTCPLGWKTNKKANGPVEMKMCNLVLISHNIFSQEIMRKIHQKLALVISILQTHLYLSWQSQYQAGKYEKHLEFPLPSPPGRGLFRLFHFLSWIGGWNSMWEKAEDCSAWGSVELPLLENKSGEISRRGQVGAWDQEQRRLRAMLHILWGRILASTTNRAFQQCSISLQEEMHCFCRCSGVCVCVCVYPSVPVKWDFGKSMQPWSVFKPASSLIMHQVPSPVVTTLLSYQCLLLAVIGSSH